MSDPTNNVSPQSHDFANIGTYMANVENRISSLDRAVTDEVKKLVSYVRGLDENVEAAKYGKYRGNDDNAKLYASEITELKEEKKVWPLLFTPIFIFFTLVSPLHNMCVGVAVVGTGDAQCGAILLFY